MLFTFTNVALDSIVDGDTVHLSIDQGFRTWRRDERYRLARINAPEIKTPEGLAARDALTALLAGKKLAVITSKADNYGRYLVELSADGLNVNDAMVASGHAVVYP